MRQMAVLAFLFCLQVTNAQMQDSVGLAGSWYRIDPATHSHYMVTISINEQSYLSRSYIDDNPCSMIETGRVSNVPTGQSGEFEVARLDSTVTSRFNEHCPTNFSYSSKISFKFSIEDKVLSLHSFAGGSGSVRNDTYHRMTAREVESFYAGTPELDNPSASQRTSDQSATGVLDASQQLEIDQQSAALFQQQLQQAQSTVCYGSGTAANVCNGLKAANIGRLQASLNQANAKLALDQQAPYSVQQPTSPTTAYSAQPATPSTQSKSEYIPGLPQCTRTQYTSADASLYIVNSCSVAVTVGFTSDSGNTWGQGDVGPNAKSETTAFGIGYNPKRDGNVYLFTCPKGTQPVMTSGNAFFPHDYKGQYTCHR